ncbi:phosphoribosyltransferase family protein [Nonomuraea turcica]|uniref:phosphoribosyltransferase family protein n=1 Tax=Nonomuraea sp. G32 TaxID=3067274 RepID=UPI00273C967E|nr:phosphoribosyltransferase family protein [Nonomuraea sp. G32]
MDVRTEAGTLVARLRTLFTWRDDGADIAAWWAHADVLSGLGAALAHLHAHTRPSVVIAPEASGFIIGPLVALEANAGFVEMRKGRADGDFGDRILVQDRVLTRSTPPDFANRTLDWVVQRRVLRPGHRVLFVDDWVETAATAQTARRIVEDSGATWIGAAVIVDATSGQAHPDLRLRALLRRRELS